MSSADSLELALFYAAERLGPLREEVVFVGGAIRGLLVTDIGTAGVRPTDDVDVIVEVSSHTAYRDLENRLRHQGFKHDLREDAPICRFVNRSTTLDVMPTKEEILGFSNPWYAYAFATAREHELLGPGPVKQRIRVITAASFLATKLVAYSSRGCDDPFHHDLEDIVAVVDGRASLLGELKDETGELRACLAEGFDRLFAGGLEDHIGYHLPSDSASQARLPLVLQRLRALVALAMP